MAGGFGARPFVLNPKCIAFAVLVVALVFARVPTTLPAIAAILTLVLPLAYVAMAWYDYAFDCTVAPFKRSMHGVTVALKPPVHRPSQIKDTTRGTRAERLIIYLSHVLLIVPLLAVAALQPNLSPARQRLLQPVLQPVLLALAVTTFFYHAYATISQFTRPHTRPHARRTREA